MTCSPTHKTEYYRSGEKVCDVNREMLMSGVMREDLLTLRCVNGAEVEVVMLTTPSS